MYSIAFFKSETYLLPTFEAEVYISQELLIIDSNKYVRQYAFFREINQKPPMRMKES